MERHFAAGKASISERLKPQSSQERTARLKPCSAPEFLSSSFANEFFDALPVEVLSPQGELRIAEKDGRFVETWVPASAENLEYLDRYSVHPEDGERVETARIAQNYMSQLAASIQRGLSDRHRLRLHTRRSNLPDAIAGRSRHTVSILSPPTPTKLRVNKTSLHTSTSQRWLRPLSSKACRCSRC